MLWYFPSWNGDVRIAAHPDNPRHTLLTIIEPTAAELEHLEAANSVFRAKGWTRRQKLWLTSEDPNRQEVTIEATLLEVGTYLVGKLKPGVATLTAVTTGDGNTTAMGTAESGYLKWISEAMKASGDDAPEDIMFRDQEGYAELQEKKKEAKRAEEERKRERAEEKKRQEEEKRKAAEEAEKKKDEKEDKKAATVKRPTTCCPDQIPGEIGPATEVLLAFCTPEQREQWQRERRLVARGGITGHRYLLAHRHTKTAQKNTKICYDLDDDGILHFHDWRVPPEEEILAAKLILEHREPWLRNEATCLRAGVHFKNPFGDCGDGTHDASFTHALGELAHAAHRVGGFLKGN
jgi:hypothetical protein